MISRSICFYLIMGGGVFIRSACGFVFVEGVCCTVVTADVGSLHVFDS